MADKQQLQTVEPKRFSNGNGQEQSSQDSVILPSPDEKSASAGSAASEFEVSLRRLSEQQQQLLQHQKELLAKVADTSKTSGKDVWDRLATITPIVSALIIAVGGAFFTFSYNQQQLKLQEAQTIERFIPHLLGDEKSKRAAILAISSLTDTKLAAKVASIFASPGTVSALESLAANDSGADKKAIKNALTRTLDNMAGNYIVEKRYDDAIATSLKVLNLQEQNCGPNSSELVPNLNRIAELYAIHKNYGDAESTLKRAADIQKNAYGPASMPYAAQLRRLSSLYTDEGLDDKADSVMNQAIAIEQTHSDTTGSVKQSERAGGDLDSAGVPPSFDDGSAPSADSGSAPGDKSPRGAADSPVDPHASSSGSDSGTKGLQPATSPSGDSGTEKSSGAGASKAGAGAEAGGNTGASSAGGRTGSDAGAGLSIRLPSSGTTKTYSEYGTANRAAVFGASKSSGSNRFLGADAERRSQEMVSSGSSGSTASKSLETEMERPRSRESASSPSGRFE